MSLSDIESAHEQTSRASRDAVYGSPRIRAREGRAGSVAVRASSRCREDARTETSTWGGRASQEREPVGQRTEEPRGFDTQGAPWGSSTKASRVPCLRAVREKVQETSRIHAAIQGTQDQASF